MKKVSQTEKLKAALQARGELNSLQIIHDLRILNYKGRISDLRRAGMNITTVMKKTPHGNAEIAHYQYRKQLQMNLAN